MSSNSPAIDILENSLRRRGRVLDILLIDRTRSTARKTHHIIWATESYLNQWPGRANQNPYRPNQEITKELVTGGNGQLIQPRAAKSREEQLRRTKDKAEVFTPLSIVGKMNRATARQLHLPAGHTWQDFVSATWLEVACGEGPYIASRYNPVANTQHIIQPKNRVGFLDEKLKIVNRYCDTVDDWLTWAETALKSCYGYEWQGDNLLIARENILMTLNDFYKIKFEAEPRLDSQAAQDGGLTTKQLEHFAEIISWNLFQMDGIKYVIPMSCKNTKLKPTANTPTTLFDLSTVTVKSPQRELPLEQICLGCKSGDITKHTGIYAKTMDWSTSKPVKFYRLLKG